MIFDILSIKFVGTHLQNLFLFCKICFWQIWLFGLKIGKFD